MRGRERGRDRNDRLCYHVRTPPNYASRRTEYNPMNRRRLIETAVASLLVARPAAADGPFQWFRPISLDRLGTAIAVAQGTSKIERVLAWLEFAIVELDASVIAGRVPTTPLGWNNEAFQDAYNTLQTEVNSLQTISSVNYIYPAINDFRNRFTVRNQLRSITAQAVTDSEVIATNSTTLRNQKAYSTHLNRHADILFTLGSGIVEKGLEHSAFLTALGPDPFYQIVFKGFDIISYADSIRGLAKQASDKFTSNEVIAEQNKRAWLNHSRAIVQLLQIESVALTEGATELGQLRSSIQAAESRLNQLTSQLREVENSLSSAQEAITIADTRYQELLLAADQVNRQRQQSVEIVRSLTNIFNNPDLFYNGCPSTPPSPYSSCTHHEIKRLWLNRASDRLSDAEANKMSLAREYRELVTEANLQREALQQANSSVNALELQQSDILQSIAGLQQELFLMRLEFESLNRDVQLEFSILENDTEQQLLASVQRQVLDLNP